MNRDNLEVGKEFRQPGDKHNETITFIGEDKLMTKSVHGDRPYSIVYFIRFFIPTQILAYKKLYAYRMDSGQVIWRTALQEGMDRIHNFDIEVGK